MGQGARTPTTRMIDAGRRMLYELVAMGLIDLARGPVEAVVIAAHQLRHARDRDLPAVVALVQALTESSAETAETAIARATTHGLVLDDGVVTLTPAGDAEYQSLRRDVRWYRRQPRSYPHARNDCTCHARDADLRVQASQPHDDSDTLDLDTVDLTVCHECLVPLISHLAIREQRTLTVRAVPDAHPHERPHRWTTR